VAERSAIRIVSFGLGTIGCAIAKLAVAQPDFAVVAAVDIDPAKTGVDLGHVLGLDRQLSVRVTHDPAQALEDGGAGALVLHSTGSRLTAISGQLEQLLRAGASIVSTCEELSYPWLASPEIAAHLDRLARDNDAALVGTGVNPGFVMDALPAALLTASADPVTVTVTRVVDTRSRRPQLRAKTGAGLSVSEFKRRVAAGELGHVGLRESSYLVARAAGWALDSAAETIDPVRDASDPDRVTGIHQVVRGRVGGQERVVLDLTMAVAAPNPRDEIMINGNASIDLVIRGGVAGDHTTTANVISCARRLACTAPGLRTVLDLPLAAAHGG
jgi:2,4-diaminopentanoate dehydrogenase